LLVDSQRALIGSGAHSEIQLPPEHCAIEQLVVEARSTGVFAQARSMDPPALLNGVPFTEGRLLPESVLRIGNFELSVESHQLELEDAGGRKKKPKTNPLTYAVFVLGFPLGIYAIFALGPREQALGGPPPAPALWNESAKTPACSQSDPQQASALARQELARAEAKRERSPFYAEDGVAAVELYERATGCFVVANEPAEAGSAREHAGRLRRDLSRQYHVHRVRLERSLVTKHYDATLKEARIVRRFLQHNRGVYTSWLANLERQIELKFAGKKK
jgi:hypothetical protein